MVEQDKKDHWQAIEANPVPMNLFLTKVGFDVSRYAVSDLLSIEEWAQEMITGPVLAVMLLYRIKPYTEEMDKEQQQRIKHDGQVLSSDLYFMKQRSNNACGTIALFHSVLNSQHRAQGLITKDSILQEFIDKTTALSPDERADFFQNYNKLETVHQEAVNDNANQSSVQNDVDTHFVAFVLNQDANIYEFDGRKQFPINHGASSENNFLPDACKIVKTFMDRDPEELRFTLLVIATPSAEEDN